MGYRFWWALCGMVVFAFPVVKGSESNTMPNKESESKHGFHFCSLGKKTCPNNTTLIYTGITAGKHHNKKGSGTNILCATDEPKFDNTERKKDQHGELYGAEYEWVKDRHNFAAPCSVCLAPQSITIMIPATNVCPAGWTPQYSGHLVADAIYFATENVCLDQDPDYLYSSAKNENQALLLYTVVKCGHFHCPPYIEDKVATCIVCSK